MNCWNCGATNDDITLFCNSCGANLLSLSIRSQRKGKAQRDSRSETSDLPQCLSLVDALYHTLKARGLSILKEPKRLLAYTADVCSTDASGFRVFERNCDREMLEPFVDATSRSFGAGELDDAASRTYLVLCDRSIDTQAADVMAKNIRNAIARYASLPEVEIASIANSNSGGTFGGNSDGSASRQPTSRSWSTLSQTRNEPQRQRRPTTASNNPSTFGDIDYIPSQSSVRSQTSKNSIQRSAPRYAPSQPHAPSQPYEPQPPVASTPKRSGVTTAIISLLITLIISVGVATYLLVQKPAVQTEQVTVTFSGGSDAKGEMNTVEVDKDGVLTLPSCDFTRDGYSFNCWHAVDKDYSPGNRVTVSENTTFTATWTSVEQEPDKIADDGSNNDTNTDSNAGGEEPKKEESPAATTPTPTPQPQPVIQLSPQVVVQPAPQTEQQPVAQPAPQTESQQSPAESFPRKWQGTYTGTSSYVAGDHHITRAVAFNFSTVTESGYLEGTCYVGTYDRGDGETYGSYYISGNVDWDTGTISFQGTGWIDRGGLGELRDYSGSVNFSAQTMNGTACGVGTGSYETPWNVSVTGEIAIEQDGSVTRV